MNLRSFTWVVMIFISATLTVATQSRPQTDPGSQKANKRPPVEAPVKTEATPEPTPQTTDTGTYDDEVLKIDTNLVMVPVKVSDRSGRFIAGLKKEDFKLLEDNVEQEITYFSTEEQPFTVVLML